ncbi:EAL domain-containing protein [Neptuniibacter caesariensis]|uniref:GGDEF domain-containing protein n=1 Tax=Neptuniibacter caesariensis TaxID=207954 RepID=A0A7U8C747_NEPCE|nr:EAL domain-containing protein [Neptuniibacter caesariensis]EAR62823.1 hypothetical protein MED92_06886 [Oceanospirillum sp. MED92] [Neptuniibacter caesariensis]
MLVILPLLLVALGGGAIYLNLLSESEAEARIHGSNITSLLSTHTNEFISNRVDAVELLAGETLLRNSPLLIGNDEPKDLFEARLLLNRYCKTLNASLCYIMNVKGDAVADSRPPETSIVGNNYGFRPYFKQAIWGESSIHLALGVTTKKRGIYFSSPIISAHNKIVGVAVIKFLPAPIEQRFAEVTGFASLVDPNGIVFASNQPDWLYKSLFKLSPQRLKKIAESRQFGDQAPESLGFTVDSDNNVSGPSAQNHLLEQVSVSQLPGWSITYLYRTEHITSMEHPNQGIAALSIIIILFLLTLFAVKQLYSRLVETLRSNAQQQKDLERSEHRLQNFDKVSSEAIFIHNSEGIVDVNKQAEKMFGYTHTELLQLKPDDFFSAESLPVAMEKVRTQSETPYQATVITRDGTAIPVTVNGKAVLWNGQKARAASFRDITRRIEYQKRLMASEDRFRQLSDLVAEGLLIYSENKIIDVNQSLCELFGQRREDLLESDLSELFSEQSLTAINNHPDTAAALELSLERADGTLFPAEITTASMQFDDGLFIVLSIRDISRYKEQEEHILYQAQFDLLTHIPNRFLAKDRAEQAIRNADKHDGKLALMFIDLDGFKKVNDSMGHEVGDQLLQQATRRFVSCIEKQHTLARHGGDEFIIIQEDIADPTDSEIVAEKILQQFSNPFSIENKQLIVTASIGISIYPDDANNYSDLLRAADIGMYKAKHDGRNRFHYYTQEMNDIATRKLALDNSLREALQNREFNLVFQPLICNVKGQPKVQGAEALIRWTSPVLGQVSPVEFIPHTEQSGLIIPIGRWVLEQACQQAKRWVDDGQEDVFISVNVSPRQFKGNDLLRDLTSALESSGLHPHHLNIEVTEGLLIEASPELNNTLQLITDMGINLSMDDFGTGYSSLNYLKKFPFNNLKIDRSFIKELPDNSDSAILVTATIAMAHQLGLSVTAEGIETAEQYNYLRGLRCDRLQGFYMGKPVPANEFSFELAP